MQQFHRRSRRSSTTAPAAARLGQLERYVRAWQGGCDPDPGGSFLSLGNEMRRDEKSDADAEERSSIPKKRAKVREVVEEAQVASGIDSVAEGQTTQTAE